MGLQLLLLTLAALTGCIDLTRPDNDDTGDTDNPGDDFDVDQDGYVSCLAPDEVLAEIEAGTCDCDDTRDFSFPGAPERLDGRDTNCDGTSDIDLARDSITILGEENDDAFGEALAFGDVNGDGVDDLIIGAGEWSNGSVTGRVYGVLGGSGALQLGATLSLPGDADFVINSPPPLVQSLVKH